MAGKGKRGQQPWLNATRHEIIVKAVRLGHYKIHAAQLAGISHFTLDQWIARGEGNEPGRPCCDVGIAVKDMAPDDAEKITHDCIYVRFAHDVRLAEAERINEALEVIRAAPKESLRNWPAAMTYLERRYPEFFGRRDRVPLDVLKEEAREEAKKLGLDPDEAVAETERLASKYS